MKEEVQDLKEIIEVAIHVSSGLDIEKIIQSVVWFIYSKYNPCFMTFILPTDMDDTRPEAFYFEGIEKLIKRFRFESVVPIIDYFNEVEYNQLPFENFYNTFPYKNITDELAKLNPEFLMPLKSDKGIVGIFILGPREDKKKKYDLTEVQDIFYIIRFASISIENSNLYRRATVDRMSKLYTHHHFQKKLEEEIVRCQRYDNYFSILMIDIDDFKKFNDTYGHLQGDIIIKEIADIINTSVRNVDFPARYGGEEFAIILPQIHAESAYLVAERLRKIVKRHKFKGKHGFLHVSISVGIAEFNKENVHHNADLIDCADRALYNSKKKGKNRVTIGSFDEIEDNDIK